MVITMLLQCYNKEKRNKIRATADAECSRTNVYTEQYQVKEKGVQHDIAGT